MTVIHTFLVFVGVTCASLCTPPWPRQVTGRAVLCLTVRCDVSEVFLTAGQEHVQLDGFHLPLLTDVFAGWGTCRITASWQAFGNELSNVWERWNTLLNVSQLWGQQVGLVNRCTWISASNVPPSPTWSDHQLPSVLLPPVTSCSHVPDGTSVCSCSSLWCLSVVLLPVPLPVCLFGLSVWPSFVLTVGWSSFRLPPLGGSLLPACIAAWV